MMATQPNHYVHITGSSDVHGPYTYSHASLFANAFNMGIAERIAASPDQAIPAQVAVVTLGSRASDFLG